MVELAVVVVTWNVRDLALQTLSSLYADLHTHGPSAKVYVVDCASTDGTQQAIAQGFPQAKLLTSDNNLGFAGGNNLALRHIGFGKPQATQLPNAVYFLNPDTFTQSGATRTLYDTLMATPRVGLVGAQLAYGDGSFQHGAFQFPGLKQLWVEFFPTPRWLIDSPFNGRYPRAMYESGKPFSIDFPLGATFMVKREVIHQAGMFDEQFFMYCEEIDWAWRIHKAGWEAQCVPAAHVVHLGGQSTAQVRPRSVIDLWTSRLRLYRKHYSLWKALIARVMVAVGIRLRARQTESLPESEREALVAAYRMVANMALR